MKKNLLKNTSQKEGGGNKMKSVMFIFIALAFIFAVNAQPAEAIPTPPAYAGTPFLWLSDGTNSIQILDGSGSDSNAVIGAITWSGTLGSWNINTSTGVIEGAPIPDLDLSTYNHSTGAATLFLWFVSSGYEVNGAPMISTVGGTQDNGSVDLWKVINYVPNGDTSGGGTLFNHLAFTSDPFSGSITSGPISLVSSDTLSILAEIVHTGAGATSFDDDNEAKVPEPGTLVLLGSGLLGFAFYGRFRSKH